MGRFPSDTTLNWMASAVVLAALVGGIALAANTGHRISSGRSIGEGSWVQLGSIGGTSFHVDGPIQCSPETRVPFLVPVRSIGSGAILPSDIKVDLMATEIVTNQSVGICSVAPNSAAISINSIPPAGVYRVSLRVKGEKGSFTIVSRGTGGFLQPMGSGTLNIVRCSSSVDTWLALALFGQQATDAEIQIPFTNPSAATVFGGNVTLQAIPDLGRSRIWAPSDGASPNSRVFNIVGPGGTAWDLIDVDALQLDPGKWTIRANHGQLATVPVKNDAAVSVRAGPALPVIFIVLGVLLGLALKTVTSSKSTMLLELQSIIDQSSQLAVGKDRVFMTLAVEEIWTRIAARPDDPTLQSAIDSLQSDLGFLVEIESLEQTSGTVAGVQANLDLARSAIIDTGDLDKAQQELISARGLLAANQRAIERPLRVARSTDHAVGASNSGRRPIVGPPPNLFWLRLGKSFIAPVTIAGLCVLGIKLLYVDALVTGTFPGAMVLLFWGMSSNVAGKSLSNMFS